jgi:hypothetical protein
MSARKHTLQLMKVAGYHGDTKGFARMYIENSISRLAADTAFYEGVNQRKAGAKCTCSECNQSSGD